MEAFSLLKYWRNAAVSGGGNGGGCDNGAGGGGGVNLRSSASTTTIVTAVSQNETDDDDDGDGDGDDGPFFDLEFAVQDEEEGVEVEENDGVESEHDVEDDDDDGVDGGEDGEFNFTISSNSSGNERTDQNLTLSPSDDLFFKGRLVPIESSSLVFNSAESNLKPPQFPVSLLKSATKFRVFMLGFKKSKQNGVEKPDLPVEAEKTEKAEKEKQSKFFTVKFKVEEVPIMSLFTRDNNGSRKSQKNQNNQNNNSNVNVVEEDSVMADEKKFLMQKYLKKVKPLYVRVSKRYGEKLKLTGQLSLNNNSSSAAKSGQSPPSPAEKPQTETTAKAESNEDQVKTHHHQKQSNIPERLRVVCKQLGKSRSASSAAVAAAPSSSAPVVQRRDDSLLQQQDNIQSAILHCKRSFNASRGTQISQYIYKF